ncbi:MAG TPA: cell division protein FtsA [Magnetospirillaceae bacterium]|nr:cell division protein FtsA [Magnetospirillaceae bacterium]
MAGLDIGTSETCAVIGEYNDGGTLEIIGVGAAPSTGLRRGVVVNIEATLKSVAQAVEAAELMSGREVRGCWVGVAGANVEGINSRGVVAVTGKGREITQSDVDRVLEAARAVVIPMDREILHVIPQSYIVDDQKGIRNPLDMIGVRLEVEVHIITGAVTTAQNLVRCVNRAGFKAEGLILQSLAAARAVLSSDEKELGCLLLDLGGGTSDVLVYSEGAPFYTNVVPAGGIQVTNDLSIMLNVPMESAERIKRGAACCYLPLVDPEETVVVPGVGGRAPQEITRQRIASIVQPRMEEIFGIARDRVEQMGYLRHVKGGVVLTGGGALMPGAAELASSFFGIPARIGFPLAVGGLVDDYRNPRYSTAVGLALTGAERTAPRAAETRPAAERKGSGITGHILDWFRKEFF